jgi:hypothetical protein
MPVTKIIVQLTGGLGNQLFQYSAGRAFSESSGAQLVLDTWSGFIRDFEYRRQYALSPFPIFAREATAIERLPLWRQRIAAALKRRLRVDVSTRQRALRDNPLRTEPSAGCYDKDILASPARRNTWLTGYWQSPKYFDWCTATIARELTPPRPASVDAQAIGDQAAQTESVAIGVRLYEDSNRPGAHSNDGKLKTIGDINRVIEAIADRVDNPRFHIFCSHRAEALEAIRTPTPPIFVTSHEGFREAIESLWMLSQCRHHIVSNSSFYWWGAWLAEQHRTDIPHHVFAAGNFINRDTVPDRWIRF